MSTLSLEVTQTLQTLLAERQEIKGEIERLQSVLDTINGGIKDAVASGDTLKTEITLEDGKVYSVTYNPVAERESLDKQLLVEQGVSTTQIKAATKTTTFEKLDIREVKAKR